jgi:hypothetical protein
MSTEYKRKFFKDCDCKCHEDMSKDEKDYCINCIPNHYKEVEKKDEYDDTP